MSEMFVLLKALFNKALENNTGKSEKEINEEKNASLISNSLRRGGCEETKPPKEKTEAEEAKEKQDAYYLCAFMIYQLTKEGGNEDFTTFLNMVDPNVNPKNLKKLSLAELGKISEMVSEITVLKSKNQKLLVPPSPPPAHPETFAEIFASKKKCGKKTCTSVNVCSKCFDEVLDIMNNVHFSYPPQSATPCHCDGKKSRCLDCSC